jgi:hypothetical protein
MIEVLVNGPTVHLGPVAILMTMNGAAVTPHGSTVSDMSILKRCWTASRKW